jgi:3',5'-cyclic-AMP phosphodiesterase
VKIAWATDTHLEMTRAKPAIFEHLCKSMRDVCPDVILLTGDISEGATWVEWASRIRDAVGVPLYFVLGNHDVWGSSFQETRELAETLSKAHADAPKWLPFVRVVKLTPEVSLVGHDGWYDCNGVSQPALLMNDWTEILDFLDFRLWGTMYVQSRSFDFGHVARTSYQLAGLAGQFMQDVICEAFQGGAKEVICATHVPPFREASEGPPENLPFYSAEVVGHRLSMVMEQFPDRKLTILCGHTHRAKQVKVTPNITVRVGSAKYGNPRLAGVIRR